MWPRKKYGCVFGFVVHGWFPYDSDTMSILETVKTAADLAVKVHDDQLKAALLKSLFDAQGEALALQQQVFQMQVENRRLSDEVRKRDEQSKLAENVFYARNSYWRKGETIMSAFCPNCWDAKRLLMRLDDYGHGRGYCHQCKEIYEGVYNGGRPNEGDPKRPPE